MTLVRHPPSLRRPRARTADDDLVSLTGGRSLLIQSASMHFKIFAFRILHLSHQPSQLLLDDWNFGQCKPVLLFLPPPPKG